MDMERDLEAYAEQFTDEDGEEGEEGTEVDAGRGGPRNSDSVLSWTPTSVGRTRSHEHSTEFLC